MTQRLIMILHKGHNYYDLPEIRLLYRLPIVLLATVVSNEGPTQYHIRAFDSYRQHAFISTIGRAVTTCS